MTEPFDPGDMVYLDQEGGDEWDDSSFSCFVTDDWSPLPEFFPDKTQSDSPSASLPTHAVALSRSDPSYGMTETQADESSTEDEVAADTLDLDTHDAASDITSIIVSAEGNHARSNHTGDGIQKPTSFGKVSMVVKSTRGSPFKCKWKHCQYSGGFSQMAALLRHIKTKHIAPGLFDCAEGGCSRTFNRKDNLVAHIRNVHRTNV